MRDEGEDGEVEQSGKPEAPAEQPGESPAASDLPDQPGQLHVPVRGRLDRTIAGRPLIVYLVLFAAAATLLLLLLIVWLEGRPGPNPPQFCTSITAGEAQQAIFAGNVERMIVLVDEEDPLSTLTGIRLEMTDDTCREPHQGADFRNDLYLIIGAAEFYNTFGDQRVSISYQRQDIPIALLSTST